MDAHRSRNRIRYTWWVGIPALALLAFVSPYGEAASVAGGDDGVVQGTDPDDEVVTFTRDVLPILQENCQVCHRPGSIGPMSFTSYEEVRPWAPVIEEQVVIRNMPPYHYDPHVGIQELKQDQRLTEEEIRTIVAWVDAGAPQGDPADAPPPVEWPDPAEWRLLTELGPPDLVIPSTPYTVPAEGNDIWHRPLVESGITEDRCIQAIEVKPSVAGQQVTHHANSTFRVQNDEGEWVSGGRLTEYAIGKLGEIIPDDACRTAPANSQVSWDIHYYPGGERIEDDVVEIGIWFHPEDHEAEYRQTLSLYGLQGDLTLAPGETTITQGFHSWDHPVRLDSFQAHGHLLLRAKLMEMYDPATGQREILSLTPNFNPGWHISYLYEDHAAPLIPAGAVVILTAWYDNSEDNPFNPDPEQWVTRGSRTADEMSHAWIAVTHLDDEGYERILAQREQMSDDGVQTADDDE